MSKASASQARESAMRSRILNRDWRYIVYTPPGYDASRRYPVMYLLHGNYAAPADLIDHGGLRQTADRLILQGTIPPIIIAMPDGGDSWYVNCGDTRMEDAILQEFIPHIERCEHAISARAARSIGGISMGGYGALRFALKRPGLFCAAALMSPAIYAQSPHESSSARWGAAFCKSGPDGKMIFDPQAWQRQSHIGLMEAYLAENQPLRFYIDSGDCDEFSIQIEAQRLYRLLRKACQPARFGLAPGGHDWPTWTNALDRALRYVFANRAQSSVEGPHQPGR